MKKGLKTALIVIGAIFALLFVIGLFMPDIEETDADKQKADTEITKDDDVANEEKENEAKIEEEIEITEEVEEIKSTWKYQDIADEMDGTTNYVGLNTSTNQIEFEFPYDGGSTLDVIVRNIDGKNDVAIRVSKGQFMSSYQGEDYVRLKFDDGQPIKYPFNSAENGSSEIIFLHRSADVINKLKTAKKLMVELPFYDTGRKIFYFDCAGFNWEK